MEPDPRDSAQIFSDALGLDAAARRAFLDEACGDDSTLRAEVESLLAVHGAASDFFRSGPSLDEVANALPEIADALIGRQVGAYRILRTIASGGMGSVYLGERTDDAFRKEVAIKLLRTGLAGPEVLARFRTERQVLAGLEHPGIARLIDGGSTADDLPFLVMEYVDGIPIDRHCDDNRLPVTDRISLFLEVCEAVSYAHKNLVIHRDLKPSNILVDRSGRPKLLDFGIAKVLEPSGPGDGGDATMTSLRALTPRYASPEQVRGGRMTTATDVYSLGVVLFELLTGALPYRLTERTPSEVERAICEEEATTPSRAVVKAAASRAGGTDSPSARRRATPQRLAQSLAGDLDTILLKALSKEPERRYATVEDFAADIRRHLDGRPVRARPDTAAYRVSKFVRRNKPLVAGVVATVLLLAGALAMTLHENRLAVARTREAQMLAYVNSLAAAESSILLNKVDEAERRLEAAPASLRGWEWWHLRGRLDRSLRSWSGHGAGITRIAFSGDGKRFISSSVDSTVKLWELASGRCLRAWGPLGSEVESAALDPDGRFVAAGLTSGEVHLLPVAEGVKTTVLHSGPQWALVAVSPDGERVAAGFYNGRVKVWDSRSGTLLAEWKANENLALVAYSPRGTYLLSGGSEGTARVWDARTHALVREFKGHRRRVYSIAMSADEKRLATGSMDTAVNVWDVATGNLLCAFREHRASVGNVAFQPGGALIATAAADGRALVWDPTSPERVAYLRGHRSDVSALAADPSGAWIATGDWAGAIRIWRWSAEDVRTLVLPSVTVLIPQGRHLAFDPSGARLACAGRMRFLPVWRLDSVEPPVEVESDLTSRVAFTPDGRWLVSGADSGYVRISDPASGDLVRSITAHSQGVLGLAVDPSGERLVTSSGDSLLKIWSLPDLELLRSLPGHRGAVFDVRYSPSGDVLASCAADSQIRVWDAASGEPKRIFRGHGGSVLSVAFSPDGRTLASASQDGSVRLWDIASGVEKAVVIQRRASMSVVTFSADGTRLAAGGSDQIVRLFDVRTGLELVSLHGHVGGITSIAFSPGGDYLASTSTDGTVRLWDAAREPPG